MSDDLFKKEVMHRHLLLGASELEHPVALQLGGSDPQLLELATAESLRYFKYDEVVVMIVTHS